MFANFTEESCTGTGTTLTLTGANAGKIPFSASYTDGSLVAYAVEDSGGTIKVAGTGTYNAIPNTITRNDKWNWNGTVVDKNPATNIPLSSGTHTIRCDATADNLADNASFVVTEADFVNIAAPDNWTYVNPVSISHPDPAKVMFIPVYYSSPVIINQLQVEITTSVTGVTSQIGIVKCGLDGFPEPNPIEIVTLDLTSTGIINTPLSGNIKLPAGRYFTFISAQSTYPQFTTTGYLTHAMRGGPRINSFISSLAALGVTNGVINTPLSTPTSSFAQAIAVRPRFA